MFKNNPSSGCSSERIFNYEYSLSISSDNLSCHYDGNIIICFYGYNSELIVSFFNVDIDNNNIAYINSYNQSNINAKVIRSLPSSNYCNFLVCYINDEKILQLYKIR